MSQEKKRPIEEKEKNDGKTNLLKILLQQYSECCADIRNFDTLVWQTPTVLTAVLTFLGILYGHYFSEIQSGRIITLLLALGFTTVSIVALIKYRFFSGTRVRLATLIQTQLKELLKPTDFEAKFKEMKWKTTDLIKDPEYADIRCCMTRTSAYRWQLIFTTLILIGIVILLLREFFFWYSPKYG